MTTSAGSGRGPEQGGSSRAAASPAPGGGRPPRSPQRDREGLAATGPVGSSSSAGRKIWRPARRCAGALRARRGERSLRAGCRVASIRLADGARRCAPHRGRACAQRPTRHPELAGRAARISDAAQSKLASLVSREELVAVRGENAVLKLEVGVTRTPPSRLRRRQTRGDRGARPAPTQPQRGGGRNMPFEAGHRGSRQQARSRNRRWCGADSSRAPRPDRRAQDLSLD